LTIGAAGFRNTIEDALTIGAAGLINILVNEIE